MKKGSNPIVRITCAFAIGIALSHLSSEQLFIFIATAMLLALSWLIFAKGRHSALRITWLGYLLLPAMMGLGLLSASIATVRPGNAVEQWAGSERTLKVVALEDASSYANGTKLLVKCAGEVSGKLVLYIPEKVAGDSASGIEAYDQIEVRANIRPLGDKLPGYTAWLKNQGVFATAQVREFSFAGQEKNLLQPLIKTRRHLKSKITELMPGEKTSGLAVAMLLGDRSMLDKDLRTSFSRAGLAHVLAISGLHVGIMFVFLSKILGFLAVNPAGQKFRSLLVIACMVGYMLLTGCSPAVCRAVMMLSMMETGKLLFRGNNSLNLMAASALIQLLIDPLLLFNVGFQLSYTAVTGILMLAPGLQTRIEGNFPVLGRKVAGSLSVCLAAQLFTAPLVALHFHQFPTYFLLSNLVLLPAVSLAVVLGFSGMVLSWIPGLNQVLFGVLETVLAGIAWLSGQISSLPGAVVENFSLNDPASWIVILMTVGISVGLYPKELKHGLGKAKATTVHALAYLSGKQISTRYQLGYAAAAVLMLIGLVTTITL